MSDALPRRQAGAGEPPQDGLLHVLHEAPAVDVVGQHHERKVARRDQLHEQAMAVQRAAVGQRGHLADPADMPADAHLVVGAVLAHLRRLHLREPGTLQVRRAVSAESVAQVEPGVLHQIRRPT